MTDGYTGISRSNTHRVRLVPCSFSDCSVSRFFSGLFVRGWWHHIPGTFIVMTELDIKTFTRRLFKIIGENSFFVAEIDLKQADGYLPQAAWDWFKRREREGVESAADAHS